MDAVEFTKALEKVMEEGDRKSAFGLLIVRAGELFDMGQREAADFYLKIVLASAVAELATTQREQVELLSQLVENKDES